MIRRKTLLASLGFLSIIVFLSILLMTMNFPDNKCDCKKCIQDYQTNVEGKMKRNTPIQESKFEESLISTQAPQTSPKMNPTVTSTINAFEHKLGVIVPYRDRFEELLDFVPYMTTYLNNKKINHHIYVINQVDQYRFNRASLLNAGFLLAVEESCDYIAMHDVDLLPLNNALDYDYPTIGPYHVSAPHLHPKYHYKKFIGGILLMTVEHFKKVNGLSTLFWGWGREDDELYMRIKEANLSISYPMGLRTNHQNTFQHNHGKSRKRDYPKTKTQFKESFKRDHETGLNTMTYTIMKKTKMTIDGAAFTLLAVTLQCDTQKTPWCI